LFVIYIYIYIYIYIRIWSPHSDLKHSTQLNPFMYHQTYILFLIHLSTNIVYLKIWFVANL